MDWRKLAPWVVLFAAAAAMYAIWNDNSSHRRTVTEIGFSDLVSQIDSSRVHDVTIVGNDVVGHFQDNNKIGRAHV